jgi:hypothetical protein
MAWGATQNIVHVFFGEPSTPGVQTKHPFPEWRRYVNLRILPDCRYQRRGLWLCPETEAPLHGLRRGKEA